MKNPTLILSLLFCLFQTSFICGIANATSIGSEGISKVENIMAKNKKNKKGYKRPNSKKILGIFKRKSDCGCPSH